jgi:hypothetical protein
LPIYIFLIQTVLNKCWELDPKKRPSFQELFDILLLNEKEFNFDETEKIIKIEYNSKYSSIIETNVGYNFSKNTNDNILIDSKNNNEIELNVAIKEDENIISNEYKIEEEIIIDN